MLNVCVLVLCQQKEEAIVLKPMQKRPLSECYLAYCRHVNVK